MFATRYFCGRYFPGRYFPKAGATVDTRAARYFRLYVLSRRL